MKMTRGLKLVAVTKRYGDLVAVDAGDLDVPAGTIHAVCGENGAGKSTLLKVAAGLVVPNQGRVVVDGRDIVPIAPKNAIANGVGMVVQHFALISALTVLENILLGSEPVGFLGRLDTRTAKQRIVSLMNDLSIQLPLDATAGELGVGDKQRIEIVRCLYRDANVIILDEPTAVLTKGEAEGLYRMLRRLADASKTVVVVTHKLDEVRLFCDAATVMRKGKVVATYPITAETRDSVVDSITSSIMGDAAAEMPAPRALSQSEEVCLSVRDVSFERAINRMSFDVAAGEVVGIAGVEGNGQREMVDLLAGLIEADTGSILISGEEVRGEARGERVAAVFEDRQVEGLVLDASIEDNVLLGDLKRVSTFGWIREGEMHKEATSRLEGVGAPVRLNEPVGALSGGNQQKVVVGRALAGVNRGAKLLLLSHPTRGVDLHARAAIWDLVRDAVQKKIAVVVVSSDLDELRALSNRILVISRGRIAKSFDSTVSDDEIGRAMLAAGEAHP